MAVPILFPQFRAFDDDGAPLAGGKIYFYEAGTATPKDTYTDSGGLTANNNPVVLDAEGYAEIWGVGSYKIIMTDASDVPVGDTIDDFDVGGGDVDGFLYYNESNFIANPSFIHQLAALPAAPADNDYILPGWRVLMENASGVVPSIPSGTITSTEASGTVNYASDRLRLTVGTGEDGKFGIFQVIEGKNCQLLRGSAFASFQAMLVRGGTGIGDFRIAVLGFSGTEDATTGDPITTWGTASVDPTLAANWVYLTTPTNLGITTTAARTRYLGFAPGTYNNYAILLWCNDRTTTVTTDYVEIANVKLERGALATEYSRPDMASGLLAAQRQYFAIAGDAKVIGSGVALTSTTAKILMPLPATMRAVPTLVAVSAASHFSVNDGTGTPVACTAVTLDAASTPNMAILSITTASGLTAGRGTYMVTNNASATMQFTARI